MGTPKEGYSNGFGEKLRAPSRIDEVRVLFDQLESAKYTHIKDEVADNIISYATVGSYDGLTLMRVVERGAVLASRAPRRNEKNYGLHIIYGIEGYLADQDLLFKGAVRSVKDLTQYEQIPRTVKQIDEYFKKLQLTQDEIPQIISFRHLLHAFYARAIMADSSSLINLLEFRNTLHTRIDTDAVDDYFKKAIAAQRLGGLGKNAPSALDQNLAPNHSIHNSIMDIRMNAKERRLRHQDNRDAQPDKIITLLLKDHAQAEDRGVTIFTKKLGQVSLADIYDEKDQASFNTLIISYLHNLPKGDIFWQAIVGGLFFDLPYGSDVGRSKNSLSHPDFGLKLVKFHRWLAGALLYSGMGGKRFDSTHDEMLKELIVGMDTNVANEMLVVALASVSDRMFQEQFFENDLLGSVESAFFQSIIQPHLDPYPAEIQRVLSEVVTSELMRQRAKEIASDLTMRFGGEARFDELIAKLASTLEILDIKSTNGRYAARSWEAMQPIIGRPPERSRQARAAWYATLASQNSIHYDILYSATIEDPIDETKTFGFEFFNVYKTDNALMFVLALKDSAFTIAGSILPDGELRFENINLEKQHQSFENSVEAIIMGALDEWRISLGIPYHIEDEDVKQLSSNTSGEDLQIVQKGHIPDGQLDRTFAAKVTGNKEKTAEKKPALSPDEVYDLFEKLIKGN